MKNFYKLYMLVLLLPLIFLLSGCKKVSDYNDISPYSPREIAEIIIASQENVPVMQPLPQEDDYFTYYYSYIYQLEAETLEEGMIYYTNGTSSTEIAVFLLDESEDAEKTKDALLKYIERRIRAYTGYAPKETAILEKSIAVTHGEYAALLICEDPQSAESDFLACFSDNPPELPYAEESLPNTDNEETTNEKERTEEPSKREEETDIYNPAAILTAWKSGNTNELSEKNRSILNACSNVISSLITDGMEDWEKELAIHDWIIEWADYDKEANNNDPDAEPDPDNDNPYGLLLNKKAICAGYTSTFQLFMDLLDIECITVNGTSGESYSEHYWNMVRIENSWYCVDVTWDDPYGVDQTDELKYKYFNVTSDFMWETNHHWDENATPEANTVFIIKNLLLLYKMEDINILRFIRLFNCRRL